MNDQSSTAQIQAPHDCGICDGPLTFDGREGGYATFTCERCGWEHVAKDCCEDATRG